MKRLIHPLLGLALLAGLVWSTDSAQLLAALAGVAPSDFFLALLAAIAANLVCIRRWQLIARSLHLPMGYGWLLATYAQGISANSVLPGGILGGDVWRSVALAKQAPADHQAAGPASVFLDRVSGFWGLAWLSLLAGMGVWAVGDGLSGPLGFAYLGVLFLTLIAPFLLAEVGRPCCSRWPFA